MYKQFLIILLGSSFYTTSPAVATDQGFMDNGDTYAKGAAKQTFAVKHRTADFISELYDHNQTPNLTYADAWDAFMELGFIQNLNERKNVKLSYTRKDGQTHQFNYHASWVNKDKIPLYLCRYLERFLRSCDISIEDLYVPGVARFD